MSMRSKYNDTKTFVKKYQAPLACTAGVVIGVVITRDVKIRTLTQQIEHWKAVDLATAFEDQAMYAFINEQGLAPEFVEFRDTMFNLATGMTNAV